MKNNFRMVIKCEGILNFQLENKTKKHEAQSWKKTAIIDLPNCDLDAYYKWFLVNRFNLNFNKGAIRGAHITIISDRMNENVFNEVGKIYHGKKITFYYELEPRTNTKHWWLRVHCPEAEDIREIAGLSRDPYFGFHLTIGHIETEDRLNHSKYIFNTIKLFNILSSEPKKKLKEHNILEFNDFVPNSNYHTNDFDDIKYINGSYTDNVERLSRFFYKKI